MEYLRPIAFRAILMQVCTLFSWRNSNCSIIALSRPSATLSRKRERGKQLPSASLPGFASLGVINRSCRRQCLGVINHAPTNDRKRRIPVLALPKSDLAIAQALKHD
ncbi:MAG: hypothetical protein FWG81_07425 [Betaproteobacteria bacterium]|nr:hypothetical protein [Betaproteobacteria bacterium]